MIVVGVFATSDNRFVVLRTQIKYYVVSGTCILDGFQPGIQNQVSGIQSTEPELGPVGVKITVSYHHRMNISTIAITTAPPLLSRIRGLSQSIIDCKE